MQGDLLISIVIPSYNRADFIGRTLATVVGQRYTNWEAIVVDDGSTDNTSEVVERIGDVRIRYVKVSNRERAAARNYGVGLASGSFVTFLDSDDLLLPDHLQVAYEYIKQNPDVAVFSQGYDVVSPTGEVMYAAPRLPSPLNRKLAEGNYLSCLGVFIQLDIMLAHPFNEDRTLSGSEDYELWLRLAAHYPIYTQPRVTAQLVNHEQRSVVNFSSRKLEERIHVLKNYIQGNAAVRQYYKRDVLKIIAYLDVYLALHLAMARDRKGATQYLIRATQYLPVLVNYRWWVVVKKIVVGR